MIEKLPVDCTLIANTEKFTFGSFSNSFHFLSAFPAAVSKLSSSSYKCAYLAPGNNFLFCAPDYIQNNIIKIMFIIKIKMAHAEQ